MATDQAENTKVQEIVSLLKNDGVEAGRVEAERIVAQAREEAAAIVKQAEAERDRAVDEAGREKEKLQAAAEANIRMAVSQGINLFKQAVEHKLLDASVMERVKKELSGDTVGSAVLTIVEAFARSGFASNDLSIILNPEEAASLRTSLLAGVAEKLSSDTRIEVKEAAIPDGFVITSSGGNLTLEVTEETIQEVLLAFLRSDFRKLFLNA